MSISSTVSSRSYSKPTNRAPLQSAGIINLSQHESKRGGWHSEWSAGQKSKTGFTHNPAPEKPDPLGSYEADWEYQGRYLELERKLLEDTQGSSGVFSPSQPVSSRGPTPARRRGARSDVGRGSDYEAYEGFWFQREAHGHAITTTLEEEQHEPGLVIKQAQFGGKERQDSAHCHPHYPGRPGAQSAAVQVVFRGDRAEKRAARTSKRRSHPAAQTAERGKGQRQGKSLKTKGKS